MLITSSRYKCFKSGEINIRGMSPLSLKVHTYLGRSKTLLALHDCLKLHSSLCSPHSSYIPQRQPAARAPPQPDINPITIAAKV